MNKDFLPFSKPSINQAAIDEVVACLKSGWITTGPRVKLFEQALQNYLSASHVLVLNSATAGLHLALNSFELKPGDEIITTPITFVSTLNTIVHNRAKPVLVDVDLNTYNIDITQIKEAITSRTRVIMPVHFAGIPVDLDPIYELADHYGLRVLEDAAHAIGSFYKGKIIGGFGDTQVFSFHPNKTMTTGEGGCVSTSDANVYKKINVMRFHGIDREVWNRNTKQGSQHYDVINPGFKYNMMDIQASLGLHQLQALESFIEKRTYLANRYQEIFADWPQLNIPKMPDYDIRNSWYIYVPLINPEALRMTRDIFMAKMKQHNIGTGYHYQAIHLFSFYQQEFGFKRGQFPNAETISDRIVSLPLFPDMNETDQDRVIETMKKIFNEKS